MNIKTIVVGPLEENCYILEKNNKCIIIDPGDEAQRIIDNINKEVLTILITHHHFDHIGALKEVQEKGIKIAKVTLHVGLGTFRPVKEDNIEDHKMHSEYYEISKEACDIINETKANGGRVICVGTTSCRTVESAADESGFLKPQSGDTEIFIYPGYKFKVLDCLITNFHLPESTLLMLVSALAGRESVLAAYEEAIKERYRFFSFGDAMLLV